MESINIITTYLAEATCCRFSARNIGLQPLYLEADAQHFHMKIVANHIHKAESVGHLKIFEVDFDTHFVLLSQRINPLIVFRQAQ